MVLAPAAVQAQPPSNLSCPQLAELRMGLLVRFGYCPPSKYYRQLYRDFLARCDSSLGSFQVEAKIFDGTARDVITTRPPETRDKDQLQSVLQQLRQKRCDF
jgi:hypothetical protein